MLSVVSTAGVGELRGAGEVDRNPAGEGGNLWLCGGLCKRRWAGFGSSCVCTGFRFFFRMISLFSPVFHFFYVIICLCSPGLHCVSFLLYNYLSVYSCVCTVFHLFYINYLSVYSCVCTAFHLFLLYNYLFILVFTLCFISLI